MIFLPIVDRELRVAARKRSTFWVRIIAALTAIVIASGFLLLTKAGGAPFAAATLGTALFATITWIGFAAAFAAGIFLTSDCLSEEKRDGTLGFLFLTDLRGHDVVSGKLLATSLQGAYGLLAVLPVLAVTLVLGGVTGTRFLLAVMALVNALFLSLSAGLLVSSVSRDSQKAMAGTLLLLIGLAGAGPAIDGATAAILETSFPPVLSHTSPVYLFLATDGAGFATFWPALVANQLVGWSLFAAACLIIPRAWQEKSRTVETAGNSRGYRWKFGSAEQRTRLRLRLVDRNPALWLACRERWQTTALWLFTFLLLGAFGATVAAGGDAVWFAWGYLGGFFMLLIYLGVASQAARLFVDARKSGLLELLLATPLTGAQIVRGQWQGLVRMFGLPLAVCLAVQLYVGYAAQRQMLQAMTGAPTPAPVSSANPTNGAVIVTNSSVTVSVNGQSVSASNIEAPNELLAAGVALSGIAAVIGNLAALIWFGMWMGMTSRTSNQATMKTILFVQIIPWFVVSFLAALAIPALLFFRIFSNNTSAVPQAVAYYPIVASGLATLLALAKDAAFVLWARKRLRLEFRDRAAQISAPGTRSQPPPLPPEQTPPVLPATATT